MAVFPVILIDSTSGNASDTLASGAGPATAVTGTAAATDGTNGKTVTISDAVDLSGVATDGSAALYLSDSTAGHRNFDQITAVSGSSGAWTVTVQNGFTISLSGKSWALGGRRATLGAGTSLRLYNNNGAAGDAMPGWALEMQSGHTETLASGMSTWRAGDTTNGPVIVRGQAGAATRPVLTFSGAATGAYAIVPRGNYQQFRGFAMKDMTGHTLTAFAGTTATQIVYDDIKCDDTTSYFNKFMDAGAQTYKIVRCKIRTNATAIALTGAPILIAGCDIHDCGGAGVDMTGNDPLGVEIVGNLIRTCAGSGIIADLAGAGLARGMFIAGNTVDGCTGGTSDAIQVKGTVGDVLGNTHIIDNICSNDGRYGINFTTASDAQIAAYGARVLNNNTYGNTSGAYHSTSGVSAYNACAWASGDPGVNPTYTSNSDWTPTNTALQTALAVTGYT